MGANRQPGRRLKLRPQAQGDSPEMTAEADRFAAERMREQLSTEPVDEAAAEDLLRQAYTAAGLSAPDHIHWLDGPLEMVAVLAHENPWVYVDDEYRDRVPHCVWDDARLDAEEIGRMGDGVSNRVTDGIDYRIRSLRRQADASIKACMEVGGGQRASTGVEGGVWRRVVGPVWEAVRERTGERIWRAVADAARSRLSPWIRDSLWGNSGYSTWHSICAYDEAATLAQVRFFDEYLARNEAHALARFNELVSGYWLGRAVALLVRHPRLLSFDEQGRLHSATGNCVEYHDGWGFCAWHGVEVSKEVILAPERLTRDDFLHEPNAEARRVIQERMGERFVEEIGGEFIDSGPRGVLYEIDLPGDPERVARYVHVLDASTSREYYLRVPPTIATAAEAVAWTFGLAADEYRPGQES